MEQFLNLAANHGWLPALLVTLIVAPPAILSSAASKIPGFLGAAARSWQNRQINAVERQMTFEQRIEEAVERKLRLRLAELDRFESEVVEMRKDMDELRADRDLAYDWIVQDAAWHREAELYAATQGWVFPPPPYVPFHKFKESRQ